MTPGDRRRRRQREDTAAKRTIGIYGGTFNPIHVAHLRAAEEVVERLGLSRMLFVPSARPPHKPTADHAIAPAALRLRWVARAVADNPLFDADPIEVERAGPSYLVDTLRALRARHPDEALVFVVGQDAFSEMGGWRTPREIFRLAHVAVTTRPPVLTGGLGDWLPACVRDDFALAEDGASARHRESDTTIRRLDVTPMDVSASAIRAAIRAGRSIRYWVPESIREDVLASGAYAAGAGAANDDTDERPMSARADERVGESMGEPMDERTDEPRRRGEETRAARAGR